MEETNWEEVADALATALESFMAYDGMGQGGSDDGNRGDWHNGGRALAAYEMSKR